MSKAFLISAATLMIAAVEAASAPWTCTQLEQTTDPFYRMFPAYLGTAKMDNESTLALTDMIGHCFMSIGVFTTLDYDEADESLKASVVFDLDQSLGFCTEHLQISSSFSDSYDFHLYGGQKKAVELTYRNKAEIADIQKNGLHFFTYCADPFTLLYSSVSSALMWIGGTGTSKYLPMFGDKPTAYQKEQNSQFVEQFGGIKLKERVINIVEVD